MGIFLNCGADSFESAVNSDIYVDKTGLISFCNNALGKEQRYICVSRPRRFGKTMAVDMLQAFYQKGINTESLFNEFAVSKSDDWKKYLNSFDVLRIDVAGVYSNKTSPEKALDYIEDTIIKDIKTEYPNLNYEDDMSAAETLYTVSEQTGVKFVIIIDEWDCFFREEGCNEIIKKDYLTLLRSLFKDGRSKKFTALAYITGILPIKQYNSESALNNFCEYTMTNPSPLEEYIGFTVSEVRSLCERFNMDYKTALEWYDGYNFRGIQSVCGPNSIVMSMLKKTYMNYWSKTVAFSSLSTYITMNFDGLRDSIVAMMCGGREKVNVLGYENDLNSIYTKDDALTVLIHLGYLAYDPEEKEVYIPNKEVWEIFDLNLKNTGWNEVIKAVNLSEKLLKATIGRDSDAVAKMIDECHMQNFSNMDYNDENTLKHCITLAYYTARNNYFIIREMPSGYGYADVVFIPRTIGKYPAMVVELKWNKDAETAITQIKKKKYPHVFKDYSGEILLVGINYDKNRKDEGHSCIIEKVIG